MDIKLRKKIFWSEASRGGLIAGSFFAATAILAYIFRDGSNTFGMLLTNVLQLTAAIVAPYAIAIRFAKRIATFGLTFQRAFGFMITLLMFSGIVYGAVNYIIFTADMDYAHSVLNAGASVYGITEQIEGKDFSDILSSPIFMVLNSIGSVLLYSFLPSLIIAALVNRKVQRLSNNQ